jgi:hypothetical protein
MMNTRRATSCISQRLGFGGERPHSRASPPICQGGRVLASSFPVLPAGAFSSLGAVTVEMSVSAMIVVGIATLVLLAIIRARGRAKKQLTEENGKLTAALSKSEQRTRDAEKTFREREGTVKELQSALKSAQAKIIKLELEKQVLLVRSETAPIGTEKSSEYRPNLISLPVDQEAFSPVLDSGRIYDITIEGTCKLLSEGFWGSRHPAGHADAFYHTDDRGAFSDSHEWLHIDNKPFVELVRQKRAARWHEDREAHRYTFRLKGMGQKVGISVSPYHWDKLIASAPSDLKLTVALLPEGTSLPQRIASSKRKGEPAAMQKKPKLTVQEHRNQQRQRETAKAEEERERQREIAADQTEDELTQMKIAFDRQQKIVETFQAHVNSIEQNLEINKENKETLGDALQAVLVKTLTPPAKKDEKLAEDEEEKEPHVL